MLFDKHINKYYLKYLFFFLVGIAALVFVDFFQLKVPEIIGMIINGLEEKSLTQSSLHEFMKEIMIIALILFAGRFLWRICLLGNGIRVETDLRNDMFKAMIKLSQKFFGENKTGSLMALYTNDLNILRQLFGSGILMLFDALALGIMTIVKMSRIDWRLTLISLGTLIIISAISFFVRKKIRKATKANFDAYGRLSEFIQEDFSGISVVKAFVKEKLQINRFHKFNQDNMDTTVKMVKIRAILDMFLDGILWLIYLTLLGIGSYIIYKNSGLGTLNIGKLTEFLSYFDTLIWPIMAVGGLISLVGQGRASIDRIKLILDAEVEINDNLVDSLTKELIEKNEFKGSIEYKNLSFNYPNSSIAVLKNVNFKINPGEFIGVMGETGCGKTTIVDLLLRIYNIPEGTIYLDGMDIMHLPLKYVRSKIAYVPQDNFLYSDTIENNVAFSENGEIDHDKVKEVSKLSDIYRDVMEHTNGFETVMGERGVTVSGGQKQRISIARALYKNAPILILDDSLSAVDTETEKTIINNLRELRKGLTTIIIAHRITTLQHLDRIMVVEDGTVTNMGSHEELLNISEAYKKEVKLQELEREVNLKEVKKDE